MHQRLPCIFHAFVLCIPLDQGQSHSHRYKFLLLFKEMPYANHETQTYNRIRALQGYHIPFTLRHELCSKITDLTLAMIPKITPTMTGWAIEPVDLTTRDLLATQENTEIIIRIFRG